MSVAPVGVHVCMDASLGRCLSHRQHGACPWQAMTVFSASNLPKTLAAAKEDGWLVLGALVVLWHRYPLDV